MPEISSTRSRGFCTRTSTGSPHHGAGGSHPRTTSTRSNPYYEPVLAQATLFNAMLICCTWVSFLWGASITLYQVHLQVHIRMIYGTVRDLRQPRLQATHSPVVHFGSACNEPHNLLNWDLRMEGPLRMPKAASASKPLHFRYTTLPGVRVLRDLNLTVEPGTYLAFVGASRCGKSTT